MSRVGDQSQWTAEQTLTYISNMVEAAEADPHTSEAQRNETLYASLSIAYEYLTNSIKRKITWTLSLQKLAKFFIELAFETNMHGSIKEVLKAYRSLTQGNYSDSLKALLNEYRDEKLEAILEEEIRQEDVPIIRAMSNMEDDDVPADIILTSFRPELRRQGEIRSKLRIVWEGYKTIIEIVKVSQKLETVFMATLLKIFAFVSKYNRKHEFKAFCKSLRSGLQNAFSKRDKSEQQKAIYIDIVQNEVNNRNIEIRLEQFKVATGLGLWQEAFQVLEDINELMKVRNAPVKNNLRCEYYQNLAMLFRRSNYWHYHAYACYCVHLARLTNPRLTAEERGASADHLILSLLCIPPATLQLHQSKESQEKICAMMITSTRIPDRAQFIDLVLAKGVIDSISAEVKQLWDFMSMEFTLGSMREGLVMVEQLRDSEFRELLKDVMAHRQLLWIAKVYECIRLSSVVKLIPLSEQKIKQLLLECHREKLIDFTFDESKKMIQINDCTKEMTPYQQLHSIYIETALLREKYRLYDLKGKTDRALLFLQDAQHYYDQDREKRIEDYKIKLRQPRQELKEKEREKEREEREKKEKEEQERLIIEVKNKTMQEQAHKLLAEKKMIINDIIAAKGNKTVRILQKKIENLSNEEIENLSLKTLQENLQAIQKKIAVNKEAKYRKILTGVDYFERERRTIIANALSTAQPNAEEEQRHAAPPHQLFLSHSLETKAYSQTLQQLAFYLKQPIYQQLKIANAKHERDLHDFYLKLNDNFREKIKARAQFLHAEAEKRKLSEAIEGEEPAQPEFWARKDTTAQEALGKKQIGKALIGRKDESGKKQDNSEKWGKGKNIASQETRKEDNNQRWEKGKNIALQLNKKEDNSERWEKGKKFVPQEAKKEDNSERWTMGKINALEQNKKELPSAWRGKQSEVKTINTATNVNLAQKEIPLKKQTKYVNVNEPVQKKTIPFKKEEPKKQPQIKKGKMI